MPEARLDPTSVGNLRQRTDPRARNRRDSPRLPDALLEVRARDRAEFRGVYALGVPRNEVKDSVEEDVTRRVGRVSERLHGCHRCVACANDGDHGGDDFAILVVGGPGCEVPFVTERFEGCVELGKGARRM